MSNESSVSLDFQSNEQSTQGVNQPFSHEPVFLKIPKDNDGKNISKEENWDDDVNERYINRVWWECEKFHSMQASWKVDIAGKYWK